MPTVLERLTTALADRYSIERELGAGGMATVFLAHDRKHDRNVALKVLRPELAAVIGAERFLQEIKLTANLQHPNILPLYDSGEADSFLYYVMPYVEGETLRDRLSREKQFAVDQAIEIAKDVSAALQYAHERGIVHRDIKPENILFQSGQAVVADFGIALAVSHAGGQRLTETGLSLGTPHYMSPEQATGDRELDARSDIYSLGAMLYEMLAGDPPHLGSTVQAVVAQILTEEPRALTARRRTVPPNVEAAIHRALQKLPADRFATAKEFAEAIVNPAYGAGGTTGAPRASDWRTRIAVPALAAAVLLALAALVGWLRGPGDRPAPVARFVLTPPDEGAGEFSTFAVSPDGGTIVWNTATPATFSAQLWVRRIGDLRPTRLQIPGSALLFPTVSPAGDEVAFTSFQSFPFGALQVVPLDGGPVRTLVGDSVFVGASWGTDGYLYLVRGRRLVRVPAAGGAIEDLMTGPDSIQPRVSWPKALPGGRAVLAGNGTGDSIGVFDLRTQEWRVLTAGAVPTFEAGYVVFARDRFLMAAPFDLDGLAMAAAPTPIVEVPSGEFGNFGLRGGTLVYQTSSGLRGMTLALRNRSGGSRLLPNLPQDQNLGFPAVSPDGRKLAVAVRPTTEGRASQDIWVYELPDGPLTRLTFDGEDDDPSWTPDGRRVLYNSDREQDDGRQALRIRNWDGTGIDELVLARDGADIWRTSWLPDGRRFVFYEDRNGVGDIFLASLDTPDSVVPLVAGPFDESWPVVSPDGRWLAYQSNESGRIEVYVRPLQGEGTRRQVSRQGGRQPAWGRSGRELFFENADTLYAARLEIGSDVTARSIEPLFRASIAGFGYAVLPGDSLFLVMEPLLAQGQGEERPVVAVLNFDQELKARFAR